MDALDVAAEGRDYLALPAGLHLLQDLGLDLGVPGIVELAGTQYRAGRGGRVAAALQHQGFERGLRRMRKFGLASSSTVSLALKSFAANGPVPIG